MLEPLAMPEYYWNSYTIFCLFIAAFLSFATYIVVRLIRPRFAIKVNCWFCNKDSAVPYGNRNCWDCPFCEQYNGFDENDDYNKPIPAQYDELLNHPNRWELERESLPAPSNGFCETCNSNQLLKIKQLSSFVPQHEKCFDAEVEVFKRQLDSAYKLCHKCESFLLQKLGQQDSTLHRKVFTWKIQQQQKQKQSYKRLYTNVPKVVRILQLSSLIIITFVCIQSINMLQNETKEETIPLEKIIPRSVLTHFAVTKKWICNPEFSLLGFFLLLSAILSAGKDRLRVIDALTSFTWLIMLFIQLPIMKSWFSTEEIRLIAQFISSVFGTILTAGCIICCRPQAVVGGSWKCNGSNGSQKSFTEIDNYSPSTSDQTSIFDDSYRSEKCNTPFSVNRSDLLQDSQISTTTLGKVSCKNLNLESVLDSHLQAMKISTPKKSQNMPGVFTKRIYSSQSSLLSCSTTSLNSQRNVLSPARLKTITHSSWVGGGYWANANPHYSRALFTASPSGQFSRGFYRPLNFSSSCPASRDGSVAGDDKFSVYSEPGHLGKPYSYGRRNFRNGLSPVKDFEQCANNSTTSSDSSQSRTSDGKVITPINMPFNQQVTGLKNYTGIWRRTYFQLFLGFSIAANVIFISYVFIFILT